MINEVATIAEQLQQYGQTTRYHTEIVLRTQDVAQHSFNVAWLCWLLTEGKPSVQLIMAALAHDAGERKTGDLPAPVKRAVGCGDALDTMEAEYLNDSSGFVSSLNGTEGAILKAADSLDGAFYCLRELKMGNRLIIDSKCGGAALNFMRYVRQRTAYLTGEALLISTQLQAFLEREFDEYSR